VRPLVGSHRQIVGFPEATIPPSLSRASRRRDHVISTRDFAINSFALMQARADPIAFSGPHAIGVPTRMAAQNRSI
jgi:hypothetical protein